MADAATLPLDNPDSQPPHSPILTTVREEIDVSLFLVQALDTFFSGATAVTNIEESRDAPS